ncbi:hypothetical protein BDE02_14G103300 [Populus trichocarpa]|nr:hypothetical protein BDE02_14G103300 [Populus trichocarpa]
MGSHNPFVFDSWGWLAHQCAQSSYYIALPRSTHTVQKKEKGSKHIGFDS